MPSLHKVNQGEGRIHERISARISTGFSVCELNILTKHPVKPTMTMITSDLLSLVRRLQLVPLHVGFIDLEGGRKRQRDDRSTYLIDCARFEDQ